MHLFAKFCSHASYRVLISNMTIFFSYSSPKIPKEDIFGPKFKDFFIFAPIFAARQTGGQRFHLRQYYSQITIEKEANLKQS